ncbi:MAG TPA: hypothetical protein VD913_01945 [bacterium]|nr:hypothetical protein [bacterium]
MNLTQRILLALFIFLVDALVFVIPLASLFMVYILLARPAWFKDWIAELYEQP